MPDTPVRGARNLRAIAEMHCFMPLAAATLRERPRSGVRQRLSVTQASPCVRDAPPLATTSLLLSSEQTRSTGVYVVRDQLASSISPVPR